MSDYPHQVGSSRVAYFTPVMAYGKRRYRKSARTYKRKSTTKIAKDVRRLKAIVSKPEYKVTETLTTGSVTTSAVFILMNAATRGTDFTNIIGRQATWKSVQLSMRFVHNASATVTSERVNWALVVDKTPPGAAPTLANIYSNAEAQFRNLDNRRAITIIKKGSIVLDADDPTKIVNRYFRINVKTIYNNTNGGTIADIMSNALYLVLYSTQATYGPDMAVDYRCRFIDA